MDDRLKAVFAGYLIVIAIYIVILKLKKSKEIYFRMVLITFIPIFGLLFFAVSDIWRINSKKTSESNQAKEISIEMRDFQITSNDSVQESEYMAISDIIGIDDIKMRRKRLFKEINGDIQKISPYLKKFLGDNDSEVSHYAAAIITGTRQKINTVCDDMRKEHVKNPNDLDVTIGFVDSLIVYVNSGLFAKDEVMKRRFEMATLFEKMFKIMTSIDEKYYEENIENELVLNKKSSAFNICRVFAQEYPNREKPYYMFLKVFYLIGDKKYFFKVISYIRESNIVYSKKFDALIRFWEKAV